MKYLLITLGVLSTLLVSGGLLYDYLRNSQHSKDKRSFEEWKSKYNANYKDSQEHDYRYQIFLENKARIDSHNKNATATYKKGVNQFSDLTKEEFVEKYLMKTSELPVYPRLKPSNSKQKLSDVPQSVDWRNSGAVTPVKDQQQCGSCWSFSTTGMLEGVNFLRNKSTLSFSEQQLVDCSSNEGNQGCNGGWPFQALEYVEQYGILQESEYQYTAQDGTCQVSEKTQGFFVQNYKSVDQSSNGLQQAAAVQPVSVCVDASNWFDYSSGVYSADNCSSDPNDVDHAVLLVGYDQTQWVVKNSWNTSWGEQGYINLAPGNTCGILNYAVVSSI